MCSDACLHHLYPKQLVLAMSTQYSVLVVGGAGFVGHHLAAGFLADPTFAVFVLSRSAASSKNQLKGAKYIAGDLTDRPSIKAVVEDVRPTVVVHAATPSPVTGTAKEYECVNFLGTRNLLKCAKESQHVRAFIFTSSSTLAKGAVHDNLDETCALANSDPKAPAYARVKANAEIMVLHANYPKPVEFEAEDASEGANWAGYLATASLRLPFVYGTGDHTAIPGVLNALAEGQTTTTIGDGKNLWSYCSTGNAATAHILLAFALLKPPSQIDASRRVDGEAFNINDGSPFPFWGFPKVCWKFAGYDPKPFPKVTHLPNWFVLSLATFLEWVYWMFTVGTKRPYKLGMQQVEYMCYTHTYSIGKAQKRLGYEPKLDFENDVKKAVEWCLDEGGWRAKLKGNKLVKSS
ncbi:NAD(P)-binding protein [Lentithecium fluviatile CBS 122367]|uniref:NAD(P)-binding protein n=1 Tax=Lentithecium fluviatile CBS 122367 TaxID=1168545 RepID=A0A6G1IKD2_9PLEO|nr:NAD(P)-binding protein [Lentithecium fluviatile CBS 122367]